MLKVVICWNKTWQLLVSKKKRYGAKKIRASRLHGKCVKSRPVLDSTPPADVANGFFHVSEGSEVEEEEDMQQEMADVFWSASEQAVGTVSSTMQQKEKIRYRGTDGIWMSR